MKMLISAYACEPGHGSEIGVGWHWVLELSKYAELWVVTRASNRSAIEAWIALHPQYEAIHFLYYDLPRWMRFWKKGLRGVRLYYHLWQIGINRMIARTMQANDIDLFHHLTYGNALWKVSAYGRKQCFIWGPVGGLETIPGEYTRHYGTVARLREWLRRIVVNNRILNVHFMRNCRDARLILCKTEITRQLIPKKYRDKAILFTDVAVDPETIVLPSHQQTANDAPVNYLMVGRLDAWRGFDIAIEGVAEAAKQNPHICLSIVGSGTDAKWLRRLIRQRNVENRVIMLGKVSTAYYEALMRNTDVVINAALKEAGVTVAFDSLAYGKPVICIDTTGYTRYFNHTNTLKIPRGNRAETVQRLSQTILKLTDREMREQMAVDARNIAAQQTWEVRGKEFYDVIIQHCSIQ
ncbi:MAG: glycosyltransferase [Prevotellaceae bacterium]|jgi:glycosyltransferase involved in cell wall biosynthesis|nr:glycosyltransferase [Prevotellaceae bacterium]